MIDKKLREAATMTRTEVAGWDLPAGLRQPAGTPRRTSFGWGRIAWSAAVVVVVVGGWFVFRPPAIIAGQDVPVTNGFYLLTAEAMIEDLGRVEEELAVLGIPLVVVVDVGSPTYVGELSGWPTGGFVPLPGEDFVDPDERWSDRYGFELITEARPDSLAQDLHGDVVTALRVPVDLDTSITITAYRAGDGGEAWDSGTPLDMIEAVRCDWFVNLKAGDVLPGLLADGFTIDLQRQGLDETTGSHVIEGAGDYEADEIVVDVSQSGPRVVRVVLSDTIDEDARAVPDSYSAQLGCSSR